jgi:NitT/TauT family transport system substrate-binding protein
MTEATKPLHICTSSDCDCGMTRRDFLRMSALTTAAGAAPLLFAGDAMARQAPKGDDQPVKIGYLPITDATPLLVAHGRKLFEAEGLQAETPRLFRSWAQIVEAFVAGQVNVIHLLSPATMSVRYGAKFPAKVVAWNHVNGSALTVAKDVNNVADLGGKTVMAASVPRKSTWLCCRRPRWCRHWPARRLPALSWPSRSTRWPRPMAWARCCVSRATYGRTTRAA